MSLDTRRVQGRRKLHFANYDELLADARALAVVPTRQLGNWSLGQICEHLAAGMNMALDGPAFKPSLVVRLFGPFLKKRILSRGMSPGFKLPKNASGLLPNSTEAAPGLAVLEAAVSRLQDTSKRLPHVVFGPMTREEWDQLNFRHAELHLSFLMPV